jgi:two-component system, NtrC family, sensor histidine kinase AtoS
MPLGVSKDSVSIRSEPFVTPPVLRLVSDAGSAAVRHTRLAGGIDGAFYRHMVAGMRNGVLAITRDGALALINDEALRIFGLAQNDTWLGQPFAKAFEQHPDVVRVLMSSFSLDLLPNRVEMRLKPTGTVIGYTLGHVRDDRGQVIGAAMYFKDLTRVEQLVERERLRDRLVAVGELAAVFAHEVKNPLAGIEVAAGLLRRRVTSSPEAQQLLSDIMADAKMANAIVQEVLDFVRPIQLQVETTALVDAVGAAIQQADTLDRRGQITVDVDVPPSLPRLQADRHRLTQVFTNLLTNAYEALHGQGHVTIGAVPIRIDDSGIGRDGVLIEVTDNGPGIPPDVKDKVFDLFFTTKAKGSGLGLAVVRRIVDAHDGRLDLRTSREGTTIRITLPVAGGDDVQR